MIGVFVSRLHPALAGRRIDLAIGIRVFSVKYLIGQHYRIADWLVHLGKRIRCKNCLNSIAQLRRPLCQVLRTDFDSFSVDGHIL